MRLISSAPLEWCKNCQRIGRGCASHQVYELACVSCGEAFTGSARTKRCKMCVMKTTRGQHKVLGTPTKLVDSVCIDCNQAYKGLLSSKRCDPCQAESVFRRKREEYQRWRAGSRDEILKKPTKKDEKRVLTAPIVCKQCVYCVEDNRSEIGMRCEAEAFLRCKPYAPGAVPLVRKDG